MTGSLYGIGWPTINPTQSSPWAFSPYGAQGFGSSASFPSQLPQQVQQLLHIVPQQLQSLQQLAHFQQQQLQQIQQLLYVTAHQLQQFQQPFTGQFPLTGLPQVGQQIFPAQPSHVM
jgi:hypothetical protein